jgi:competence protein ComEC
VPGERGRFVAALALGDTRGLSDRDWEILRITGLTHLIAISGFHVGLVAGFGALLGRIVYWVAPGLGRRLPRSLGSALLALLLAAVYTALAGFALPTLRTLLMIAAVVLARLARRRPSLPESLCFALVAVLLIDPLSVLAPGFWLSFMGVAWLVWCLPDSPGEWLKPFLQSQAVAMLGLLPLSVWFFSQASLVGPAVNMVGIPWISLVVVPLALLGLAAEPLCPALADVLWRLSAELMHWLWQGLAWVANWPAALVWLPEPSLAAVCLALLGAFWLMLPRPVPGKPLAALLLLPLLWPALPRPKEGEARLLMLDVGQGLSLLVQTRHHTLLYDAGPAVPGGLDRGEDVVVPALRSRGLSRLDTLVISHGDNDHAGGSAAVLRALPTARVLAPEGWARPGMQACVAGQEWNWDGVRFRMLHPTPHFPYLRNDSSCVLRIETAGATALLPGDIGRHVEARLAKLPRDQVSADVLVLPHHGSDTSSSLDFLAAVRPAWGLVAVGHDNRFSLPRPIVLSRYERYGVRLLDTVNSGATELELGREGVRLIRRSRADAPRYWRDAPRVGSGYAIGGTEPDR